MTKLSFSAQSLIKKSLYRRFQTSKSGRLSLHSDVKIIVMQKTEQDTAQAIAMNSIESYDLKKLIVIPQPKYSQRINVNAVH